MDEDIFSIKYVADGRSVEKDGGLDCWGFVIEYIKSHENGNIPPIFAISGDAAKRIAIEGQMKSPSWVRIKRPESGDLILFRFFSGKFHCGIICEDCVSFIHCGEFGVKKDKLDSPLWKRITVGIYRYIGEN